MYHPCYSYPYISDNASRIKIINNLQHDVIVIPRASGAWGCNLEYPLRTGQKMKYVCPGGKAILPNAINDFSFDERAHCKHFALALPDESSWLYYNIQPNDFGRFFDTEYLLKNATSKDPITSLGTCLFTR